MVRRPSLPLLARLNELISSFGFGFVGGCTRAVSERRAGLSARDLYEDSHEKSRVFGGFGAPSAFELCGRLQRGTSQTQFHSHQSIWRYKNSARIKHSYHAVICAHDRWPLALTLLLLNTPLSVVVSRRAQRWWP